MGSLVSISAIHAAPVHPPPPVIVVVVPGVVAVSIFILGLSLTLSDGLGLVSHFSASPLVTLVVVYTIPSCPTLQFAPSVSACMIRHEDDVCFGA